MQCSNELHKLSSLNRSEKLCEKTSIIVSPFYHDRLLLILARMGQGEVIALPYPF